MATEVIRKFKAPKRYFSDLDAEATASLVAAAADISLVLDGKGIIRDVSFGSDQMSTEGYGSWIGQPWTQTVTQESRPKIEALLRDALAEHPAPRWRQVNHVSPRGANVPVLYSALPVGKKGRVVALGRDLRSIAALQQQLVGAQQSMERDFSRLRQMETRYRLLFQLASEAVLIVDAASLRIVEANPAAQTLLGTKTKSLVGKTFPIGLDAASTPALQQMLATVRAAGRPEEIRVRKAGKRGEFTVAASLFRQENTEHYLIRLTPLDERHSVGSGAAMRSRLLEVIDEFPDGFVCTDPEGSILSANRAFLDMVDLASEEQARGASLDRWLGRPGVDLGVLLANLRQHGSVRLFATSLRGEYDNVTEVEISAVAALSGEPPCLGFVVRNVGRRLAPVAPNNRQLPRSVEQLRELIGRMSLKDLVREATDVIERLCIEAALELTNDNRASASEVLGLSRQSFYVKLRRYGLGELDGGEEKK